MTPNPQPGYEDNFTLESPGRYSCLTNIRQAVLGVCARAGLEHERTAQLEMAVDEACSNIIEHSYGGEDQPRLELAEDALRVHFLRTRDRIVVEIFDRGTGFDFGSTPAVSPPDYLTTDRQRGLGLYIIRCFVDDASYQRGTPQGNCLRLTKLV
jgi:serine/threonine-protein kinase RsbW